MTSPTMSPGLLRIDAAALGGAGASPCSTSPGALVKCLPLPATRRTLSSRGFQTNSTYPSRLPPELSLCFPSSTLCPGVGISTSLALCSFWEPSQQGVLGLFVPSCLVFLFFGGGGGGYLCGMQKFLGQGSNHSSGLSRSSDNARALTWWATRELLC